jgi:seryl-tRNA synthetase
MLDLHLLRKQPEMIQARLRTKDSHIDLKPLLDLDEKLRDHKTEVENLKSQRNRLSKEIGELKRRGESAEGLMEQVSGLGERISGLDCAVSDLESQLALELAQLPNLPMEGIKVSPHAADNVIIKTHGNKPEFAFPFKNHLELNEALQLFDFKRAAKISGSGWAAYRGFGARLEWALINYMVQTQIKNGFELWMPPLLVREETVYGSGQLPKFANQQFKLQDEDHRLYLIPTSEVPLNGLHAGETLSEEELPIKYTAYTPCFRREAGAAGAQERGLIRTHQFNKVEMFAFTAPDQSDAMFDAMLASAEEILQGLGLHYRNALLVTGDMSFAAAKTVDIEVWLPGQGRYYEVSSVSNCTDYQARRSNTRYKDKHGKLSFVHTLNGSGLATSRLMVALLENNQQADGSVLIPEVLQPMLGGLKMLTPG